MQTIPLQAIPAQTVTVTLGAQPCTISVAQKSTGLFLSLSVRNATVISGVLCLNQTKIVRDAYLGFSGDLAFYDTTGSSAPDYTGLGARFILVYIP
jgi:hypothetical protein